MASKSPSVFKANPQARRAISRSAYLMFSIGIVLMACSGASAAVSFAIADSPSPIFLILAILVALGGLGTLIVGIITLARVRERIQVEVTPHRLVWREGNRIATLEFDEVERIDVVKDEKRVQSGMTMVYPVVRFVENDGEMMEFEISFEDRGMVHHSRFDTQAITRSVLPYVRHQARVAPAVEDFVNSGQIDIDGLPER
ncbi:MAG: hypothetical protein GYB68_10600 [Chloroflexi bacterium]|nr:hypothetical protein [Chloroflexota bacterium]